MGIMNPNGLKIQVSEILSFTHIYIFVYIYIFPWNLNMVNPYGDLGIQKKWSFRNRKNGELLRRWNTRSPPAACRPWTKTSPATSSRRWMRASLREWSPWWMLGSAVAQLGVQYTVLPHFLTTNHHKREFLQHLTGGLRCGVLHPHSYQESWWT